MFSLQKAHFCRSHSKSILETVTKFFIKKQKASSGCFSYNTFFFCVQIVGVSILRAGETMEQALCEVYKNITIGKILIQTNFDTGEPEVRYPNSIAITSFVGKLFEVSATELRFRHTVLLKFFFFVDPAFSHTVVQT